MEKLIKGYRTLKHRYLVKLPNDYQGLVLILILIVILLK